MTKCPKCGTQMVEFRVVRSKRIPGSMKEDKILVTGIKCPKCPRCERSIKETPLEKEKPRESKEMVTQPPQEILSQ